MLGPAILWSGAAAVVAAAGLRLSDIVHDRGAWSRLSRAARLGPPLRFDPTLTAALPEAARRYFAAMIRPGAVIASAVELTMGGSFGLGTRTEPRYRPMRARQILAPSSGFVWQVAVAGIRGSDGLAGGRSWTRFALGGLVPVVRASGPDHLRSSLGRAVIEGLMWCPGGLLARPGIVWSSPEPNVARVTVTAMGHEQSADVRLGPDDRPSEVVMQRWSNANPDKVWRWQPFGGTLSDWSEMDGQNVPTRIEGGNLFGTEDYFPFFRAEVTEVRFLRPA